MTMEHRLEIVHRAESGGWIVECTAGHRFEVTTPAQLVECAECGQKQLWAELKREYDQRAKP